MERLAAIVLAAGRSSRMGEFKPLLDVEGRTLLEWAVAGFRGAGVDEVLVVTGHRAGEVGAVAERAGARAVANPEFDHGMFSSARAGVAALDAAVSRFFLLPADVPLVRPETIGRLARAARDAAAAPRGAPDVVYPAAMGATGHPPLVSATLREEIIAAGPDGPAGGLRPLLMEHIARSAVVDVGDPGILLDADTPDDLAGIRERAAGEGLPDEARCLELLGKSGLPETRIAHSRAVAAVATALAAALDARGQHLCEPLVLAGGLLHDIARDQPRHADAGADMLSGCATRAWPPSCVGTWSSATARGSTWTRRRWCFSPTSWSRGTASWGWTNVSPSASSVIAMTRRRWRPSDGARRRPKPCGMLSRSCWAGRSRTCWTRPGAAGPGPARPSARPARRRPCPAPWRRRCLRSPALRRP